MPFKKGEKQIATYLGIEPKKRYTFITNNSKGNPENEVLTSTVLSFGYFHFISIFPSSKNYLALCHTLRL